MNTRSYSAEQIRTALVASLRAPTVDHFEELVAAMCALVELDPTAVHQILECEVPHDALAILFNAVLLWTAPGDVIAELAELVADTHRERET